MSIIELIDEEEALAITAGSIEYNTLMLDPYVLMQLSEELGYGEDDHLGDPHILETYKDYKIVLLEDGPDTIKFV